MKVITDYFASPVVRKKQTTHYRKSDTIQRKKENYIFSEDGEVFYETRKIKIRLADPNVPDSYVCEVYDTSIDDDTVVGERSNVSKENRVTKKNAYSVLMADAGKSKKHPLRKRGRPKKSSDSNDSDISSDEALIFIKKKLKGCDSGPNVETLRRCSEPAETNSSILQSKKSIEIQNEGYTAMSNKLKCSDQGNRTNKQILENKSQHSVSNTTTSETEERVVRSSKRSKRSEKNAINVSDCSRDDDDIEDIVSRPSSSKRLQKNDTPKYEEKISNDFTKKKNCQKLPKMKEVIPPKLKNEKKNIAPLFRKHLKKEKKEAVDPEILKARQRFLQLGLPTAMRKKVEVLKAQDAEEVPFFPSVSHVQQRLNEKLWNKRCIKLNLKVPEIYIINECVWKLNKLISNKTPETCFLGTPILHHAKKVSKIDTLDIDKLKEVYRNVQIDNLLERLKKHKAHAEVEGEIYPVWTDKYRPGSAEIFSNERTVAKLSKWMMAWKNYGEYIRKGFKSNKTSNDGSSDDFVSSDEDSEFARAPLTACLLQGSVSSGKTALVHALATEMDFNVLEINCSSKRSGKKMLADLQEATQSHKILQKAKGSLSRNTPESGKEEMTVIVVEEADIMFEEQDEGFVSGLQALVTSAKRPVVLLTSDPTVQHLDKFRTSQTLQLTMVRPQRPFSCAVLELISLLEGVSPPRSLCLKLLARNNLDLRRSLLELQFWLQHGGGNPQDWSILGKQPVSADHVWWASHQLIFKRDLWRYDPTCLQMHHRNSEMCDTIEPVAEKNDNLKPNLLSFFENLSICDVLGKRKLDHHSDLNYRHVQVKDSSSLSDNVSEFHDYRFELGKEIESEMLVRTIGCLRQDRQNWDDAKTTISEKETRWLAGIRRASDELLNVVPESSSSSARRLDYLPVLRTICRTEQERNTSNTKRRNRFYHYLRTLGGNLSEANLAINCQSFQPVHKARK